MDSVGISDLKTHAGAIVRRVRDRREPVDVTIRGRIVARIIPVERRTKEHDGGDPAWADLKRLAAEIDKHWPAGVSATDAVREGRREL
jgi:prevent-host-death family protein